MRVNKCQSVKNTYFHLSFVKRVTLKTTARNSHLTELKVKVSLCLRGVGGVAPDPAQAANQVASGLGAIHSII